MLWGPLYWRGVWEQPIGHAYILKILMTAEKMLKEKKKKKNQKKRHIELFPLDRQPFPLDERTFTFFLLSIAAVAQSVRAFASGSLGVQFPAATDLSRKNIICYIICYIIAKLHYQTLGNRYECHLSSEMTNLYERFISKNI